MAKIRRKKGPAQHRNKAEFLSPVLESSWFLRSRKRLHFLFAIRPDRTPGGRAMAGSPMYIVISAIIFQRAFEHLLSKNPAYRRMETCQRFRGNPWEKSSPENGD